MNFNLEAEMSVLGGALLDSLALDKAISSLSRDDFYLERHQQLFIAMCSLVDDNQVVDLVTMTTALKERGKLESCGGSTYLAELIDYVPTTANIGFYLNAVKKEAIRRRLLGIGKKIPSLLEEHPDPNIASEKVESLIFSLKETSAESNCLKITVGADDVLHRWDQAGFTPGEPPGLRTGFSRFDLLTGGVEPGNLYLLAARPGVGKTGFAIAIAESVSVDRKVPVLFFSLEMGIQQLAGRLLSSIAEIDSALARIGSLEKDQHERLGKARKTLQKAPLFIDDTAAISISEIRYQSRKMKRQENIQLIVVDYLQLVTASLGKGANREAEVATVSRGLKALARELSVPVVALCQLNRSLENRVDKRPMLSDLRESGSLEQDADIVAFLHRPGIYDPQVDQTEVDLLIGKNRHGPLGQVKLTFKPKFSRFTQRS